MKKLFFVKFGEKFLFSRFSKLLKKVLPNLNFYLGKDFLFFEQKKIAPIFTNGLVTVNSVLALSCVLLPTFFVFTMQDCTSFLSWIGKANYSYDYNLIFYHL
jgi:hypothetical protein